MNSIYLVFDVESLGLYGKGFAYGFVVVDEVGNRLEQGIETYSSWIKRSASDLLPHKTWALDNVVPVLPPDTCDSLQVIRDRFWQLWMRWKQQGAYLVKASFGRNPSPRKCRADCPFPVESTFLKDCVTDDLIIRQWDAPYPLLDVASIMHKAGMDPMEVYSREADELPQHNPLCDARQSARLFLEAMQK